MRQTVGVSERERGPEGAQRRVLGERKCLERESVTRAAHHLPRARTWRIVICETQCSSRLTHETPRYLDDEFGFVERIGVNRELIVFFVVAGGDDAACVRLFFFGVRRFLARGAALLPAPSLKSTRRFAPATVEVR